MIPSDIRLYTWVDVEEVLLRSQEQEQWPEDLVWARGYWDELVLGIRPGTQSSVKTWLQEVYDPRFQDNGQQGNDCIILESAEGNQRTLPIILEETEEEPPTPKLIPNLARPTVIWQRTQKLKAPDILPDDLPPVVAFHSFKGGVGRTTHALALAQALINAKQQVLLIDGDLEAPGISWLLESRLPSPPICFADIIALIHGDPSPDAEQTIELATKKLQNALVDGIYILPSFRVNSRLTALAIKPEHLIKGHKNPFILTDSLARLGKALGVNVVLVDLRAGLSELAAGLILDPRVYRIFVSTLSGQSISGTAKLLELIGKLAPSTRDQDPSPALILTKVPQDERAKSLVIESEQTILEGIQPLLGEDSEPIRITTNFTDSLQILSNSWQEVWQQLASSKLIDLLHPLLEWLPDNLNTSNPPDEPISSQSQRESLRNIADKMIYAEGAETAEFLVTESLENLANDYRNQIPITVVIGAKGSGKTYTFMQIIHRKEWQKFIKYVVKNNVDNNNVDNNNVDNIVSSTALIAPIIASNNLKGKTKEIVDEARKYCAEQIGLTPPVDDSEIKDYIREGCQQNLHEGEWRDRWLDVIAKSLGMTGKGRDLPKYLADNKQKIVAVIDGLEDLFQEFDQDKAQQTALRALLQEVPQWLEQQPLRCLGIIIFVRQDILTASVRQNSGQMKSRYQPYTLRWNRETVLRLVAWVADKADISLKLKPAGLQDMNEAELTEALTPLWGKKLGNDRSKQPRSAPFVIAALSDYNGQIQSRDVVRLLKIAAEKSISIDEKNYWQDRILVPKAIRGCLADCSQAKIEEIELENEPLKRVFNKLRQLPEVQKKNPFQLESISLSAEDISLLKQNGVIIADGDKYYISEIFRLGLGFSQNAGKPKMMALYRRARQRL
ncbi:chromosome partitioning protein ParA [Moorena producens PAL-8-15-08-1]|uniref:Chromosome partitioning protein ParA n=1 Tax=Moorena producens PAL-8-15-08-1 TaxID=1458985 RepID=A0A1D8TPB2_9CYAN|nr:AAA family ATPase [Moorena producens]AOW99225.1 chromosome partitioning protein ParA [Moorena producens PAL-8-15-08-1]